jgi:flagellar protein FliO/FliZ
MTLTHPARRLFLLLAAFVAALPVAVRAADPRVASGVLVTSQAGAATTAVPTLGLGGIVQALFGLAVVIGMVFGCAWLARRFGLQQAPGHGALKIVGSAALAQRERVVVVQVADTWLVLGVAPGNIRTLHTLPAQDLPETAAGIAPLPPASLFAKKLRERIAERARAHRRNTQ